MAIRNLRDIVGKTVSDVVVKNWSGTGNMTWQMYLFFDDGTNVEVYRTQKTDWLDCSKVRSGAVEQLNRSNRSDCDVVVDTTRDED